MFLYLLAWPTISTTVSAGMPQVSKDWGIWNQLQHFALVCDRNGLFAWGNTCLGTDFDGSIYPFPGVLTAEGLSPLATELELLANEFLKKNLLSIRENYEISPEEIVQRFMFTNTLGFLNRNF